MGNSLSTFPMALFENFPASLHSHQEASVEPLAAVQRAWDKEFSTWKGLGSAQTQSGTCLGVVLS